MAPLYYIFKYKPDVLQKLDDVCNIGKVLESVPKRMIFSRSSVQKSVNDIQDVYIVPKTSNSNAMKKAILDGIRDRLNVILDEFTPEWTIDTSFQYIQVMDCSTALYNAIQEHTKCTEDAQNSKAFCSDYAKESEYTSGLYYFLDYTMTEVPFAWWHKCMLMKGRTFASQNVRKNPVIVCDEWYKDTIKESMINKTTYNGGEVARTLMLLEGGITSDMVLKRVSEFKLRISSSVKSFISGGSTVLDEKSSQGKFTHMGAPHDFNMMCYKVARFPENETRYKSQTKPDCVIGMLNWIHNEGSDPYFWPEFNKASPLKTSSADKSCYSLNKKDLMPIDGLNRRPFYMVTERTIGHPSDDKKILQSAPLYSDIVFNDFFQGKFNQDKLLLVSELKPKNPPSFEESPDLLPEDLTKIKGVADPRDSKDNFEGLFGVDFKGYPCVKLADIEKRLPPCTKSSSSPVPLSDSHCQKMKSKMVRALAEYSRKINNYPSTFPQRRWPPPSPVLDTKDYCVWDCGDSDGKKLPVHIGLNSTEKEYISKRITGRFNECKTLVRQRSHLYRDPDQISQNVTEMLQSAESVDLEFAVQEVCYIKKMYKIATVNDWKCEQWKQSKDEISLTANDCDPKWEEDTLAKETPGSSSFASIFAEENLVTSGQFATAVKKADNYVCEPVMVRSTGSKVVDEVRSGLSYTDVNVSLSRLYKGASKRKVEKFLDKIYSLMTDKTWNSVISKIEYGDSAR